MNENIDVAALLRRAITEGRASGLRYRSTCTCQCHRPRVLMRHMSACCYPDPQPAAAPGEPSDET